MNTAQTLQMSFIGLPIHRLHPPLLTAKGNRKHCKKCRSRAQWGMKRRHVRPGRYRWP